jgi:hypothetical protein
MNKMPHVIASEQAGPKPTRPRTGWFGSLFLGLALVFIYMINGRDLGTYDTIANSMLPFFILRGGGIYFDNEVMGHMRSNARLPDHLTISHGRIVTVYPIAPALVVVPLFAPQVALLDLYCPGWDRDREVALAECLRMAKLSMALVVALAGVVLYRHLLALGVGRAALPAVLAACVGSDLWPVGSQALWQHGPAALALVTAIALLYPRPVGRGRMALAGASTALLVACRPLDIVFAIAIVTWLASTDRRGLRWFLPAPVVVGVAVFWYNVWFFDSILGGQAKLEQYHMKLHGAAGAWFRQPGRGLARNSAEPQSRSAGLQPLDRPCARDASRPCRATAALRSLIDRFFAIVVDPIPDDRFQILGLVGRSLLRSAVLDRGYPPVRGSFCLRTGMDVRAVARLGGDFGADRYLLDRCPLDRSFLLSEHLEQPAT